MADKKKSGSETHVTPTDGTAASVAVVPAVGSEMKDGSAAFPGLSLPDANAVDTSNDAASSDVGDADMRRDVFDMVAGWMEPGYEIKHSGGSLPPLFPEDPRIGMTRIVRYKGVNIVNADKAGSDNDFMQLICDCIDPQSGRMVGTGSIPLGYVMFEYFGVTEFERKPEDGRESSIKSFRIARKPEETPLLMISFGGKTEAKKGRNAANLWIIEEIRGKVKTLPGRKA